MKTKKTKKDIYQETTNSIIELIEKGCKPWQPDWKSQGSALLPIRSNGEYYQGSNILILWASQIVNGFSSNKWMTFKQALEAGGCVRKGSKSTSVIYFSTLTIEDEEQGKTNKIPYAKTYNVFNLDQIEGLDPEPELEPREFSLKEVQVVQDKIPADIVHYGGRAFYDPQSDRITLPPLEAFLSDEGYTSTRAHETIHWTGHPKRCDRLKNAKFGSEEYAYEELVAELGASFFCARFGIINATREDHASYIQGWLQKMKGDKKYIFRAAADAQKAINYLSQYMGE